MYKFLYPFLLTPNTWTIYCKTSISIYHIGRLKWPQYPLGGRGHSKKEDKDQESIQPSTTPDPGYQWKSDKFTIRHHKRELKGQPFPSRW